MKSYLKVDYTKISIELNSVFLSYFVLQRYFGSNISATASTNNKNIKVKFKCFGKGKKNGIVSDYTFDRERVGSVYNTTIYTGLLIFPFLKSCYKFLFPKSSVVGIPEVYQSAFRTSVLEPFEGLLADDGFRMIHAGFVNYQKKGIIVCGKSGHGKSTIIEHLSKIDGSKVGADNYVFINGKECFFFPEPFRSGNSISRFEFLLYGKRINGFSVLEKGEVDFFYLISRTFEENDNLSFEDIEGVYLSGIIEEMYTEEGEGLFSKKNCPIQLNESNFSDICTIKVGISNGSHLVRKAVDEIIEKL